MNPCPQCQRHHPPTFEWRGIVRPWHVRSPVMAARLQREVPRLDRICASCGKYLAGDETHVCGGGQ